MVVHRHHTLPACEALPPLLGHAIAVTGQSRFEELAFHLRALGASVVHGPMLHCAPATDDARLRAATAAVIDRPPDFLLATTGIGIRGWITAAASWHLESHLLAAVGRARVLARGPKVVGALSEVGIGAWFADGSGRTAPLVERMALEPLRGAHVAVQIPGEPMDEVVARLRVAGATVTTIAVYDRTWPDDLAPARRLLRAVVDGRVSAVTFTSRPAVRNFVDLAVIEGIAVEVGDALRSAVLAMCVGPATAEELHRLTGAPVRWPERATIGHLVAELGEEMRVRHRHVRVGETGDVIVHGRIVTGGGASARTSDRELSVLNRLLAAPFRTVSRAELLRDVWRSEPVDDPVLDATMSRLRRRLRGTGLAVHTVARRGYLLAGEVVPCPMSVAPTRDLLGLVDLV